MQDKGRLEEVLERVSDALSGANTLAQAADRLEIESAKLSEEVGRLREDIQGIELSVFGERGQGGLVRAVEDNTRALKAVSEAKKKWTEDFRWWFGFAVLLAGAMFQWASWSAAATVKEVELRWELQLKNYVKKNP